MERNDIAYIIVAFIVMIVVGGFLISLLPVFLFLILFAIVAVGGYMVYRTAREFFRDMTTKKEHYDEDGRRITKVSVIEMTESDSQAPLKDNKPKDSGE